MKKLILTILFLISNIYLIYAQANDSIIRDLNYKISILTIKVDSINASNNYFELKTRINTDRIEMIYDNVAGIEKDLSDVFTYLSTPKDTIIYYSYSIMKDSVVYDNLYDCDIEYYNKNKENVDMFFFYREKYIYPTYEDFISWYIKTKKEEY